MPAWTYTITRSSEIPHDAICFGIDAGAAAKADAERSKKAPAAIANQACCKKTGVAYYVRAVNPDTGELRESYACTNHAAWLAHGAGIPWPLSTSLRKETAA